MKAYFTNNGDPNWQFLVFAENIREAKKLAFKHMPFKCEWIDVRVWKTDDKWLEFYDDLKWKYSMPEMTDETWNEWYERYKH